MSNLPGAIPTGKSSKRATVKRLFRGNRDHTSSEPGGQPSTSTSSVENGSPAAIPSQSLVTPPSAVPTPSVVPSQNIATPTPSPPSAALSSMSSAGTHGPVETAGSVLSPTSVQVKQTPWEQAIGRIPPPECNAIDFSNVDKLTILREVKNSALESQKLCTSKQWKFHWKGKEIVLRDLAGNFINLVDKFALIGDTIAQYDPVHSALPWAGFRLILQFALNDAENMGRVLVGLEKAGQCIDRCAIYERLYLGGQVISDAVIEHERSIADLYMAVLIFQTSAIIFYRKNTFVRGVRSVFDDESFQTHLAAIEEKEKVVQSSAVLVEAEYQRSTGNSINSNLLKNHEELRAILSVLDTTLVTEMRGISGRIGEIKQSVSNLQIDKKSEFIDSQIARLDLAKGATFDAYENKHHGNCLENTRVDLLDNIEEWRDTFSGPCIFWLSGMAGTGKSTIAKTVAQAAHEQNSLGASFFFTRGGGDRGNATKFFTTIAFQLANTVHDLKPYISESLSAPENFNILERGLKDQWKNLIFQPLRKLTSQTPRLILLVIDALDECDSQDDIRLILQLFSEAKDLKTVRFCVFLTSRPELPIRYGFNEVAITSYREAVLQNVEQSIIEHDISLYFNTEFKKLRAKRHQLPQDWPGAEVIQDLVRRADKLFIYATTICRFLERLPEKRLTLLLQANDSEQSYTWTLDQMYIQVLKGSVLGSCNPREEEELASNFREIIGPLILLFNLLSTTALSQLLGEEPGVVFEMLESLGSVLDVSHNRDIPVRLIHLSFRDFLLNNQRCTDSLFWIDEKKIHSRLVIQCLIVMSNNLRKDICGLRMPGALINDVPTDTIKKCLSAETQYACQYWVRHLQQSGVLLEDNGQVHTFLQEHFLHWLEALSLMKVLSESIRPVIFLQGSVSVDNAPKLSALLTDANRFILNNRYIIEKAPLQTYYSALMFSPLKSVIRGIFSHQLPNWISVPQVRQNWNPCLQSLEGSSHGRVMSVAFSPDGKILASAMFGKVVKLWDSATGVLLNMFEAHSREVSTVVFSPDGKVLASASNDNTVKLWNPATGVLLNTFEGHQGFGASIAFSSDGKMLASSSNDTTVKLLNSATGELLDAFEGHSGWVRPIALSPDGKVLASGSNSIIKLWDLITRVLRHTLDSHSSSVTAVAFSPDSRFLASASRDKTIKLWDPARGVLQHTFEGHSGSVNAVAFSPDGKVLASASSDKTVKLWDPATGVLLDIFEGHSGLVMSVAFSPNGKVLGSASDDGTVKLWDLATKGLRDMFECHSCEVNTVAFSSDGKVLASASTDQTIKLWNSTTRLLLNTLKGHLGKVSSVAFSPDSKVLASASNDNTVKLWDSATGVLLNTFEGYSGWEKPMVFSPDGKVLALGSNNTIKLWDMMTGGILRYTLDSHSRSVSVMAFSPDSRFLASTSWDKTVKLWDLATGLLLETLQTLNRSVESVVFSPDGKVLAIVLCDYGRTVRLWDLATRKSIQTFSIPDHITELTVTSDGINIESNRGLLCPNQSEIILRPPKNFDSKCGSSGDWITWEGQKILWLPNDYRASSYSARSDVIVLGHLSGQITFIEIHSDTAQLVLKVALTVSTP